MKFFKDPNDPASYMRLLRSKRYQIQQKVEDLCVTASDAQFRQITRQLNRIEKEINKVAGLLEGE